MSFIISKKNKGQSCAVVLFIFLIIALIAFLGCEPREKQKYVVGIINPSSGLVDVVKGFKKGMEELGYREGENITYLYEGPLEGVNHVDTKIKEMLAKNVDLIYSLTTPASKKLRNALSGTDIPGVFAPVFDPVSSGIVESLARPGGPVTGVRVRGSTAKALEWLLAVIPDVKRIFIPFHVTDKAACQTLEDLQETASKFNIELVTEEVTNADELEKALTKIPDDIDALWLTCSHLLFSNVEKIVQAASARNIPTASSTHSRERSGILVTYGEDDLKLGEQVSKLADKLLKGALTETLPVETADFNLTINLKAARNLDLEIPDFVLRQADTIIR
jgi:putative ABC transport system substrate-binding protein